MTHQESSPSSLILRSPRSAALRSSLVVGAMLCATSFAWAFQGGSKTATPSGAPPPLPAPEINPALIWGAVVLVVGGLLILTGRKRRAANASKS
jgi:lipopolysaccharide export LptBFGC system permease protein LptF